MTTLDSFVMYDYPLDELPAEDLHTVEGMRRRKAAIEAGRPKILPGDMLRLDRKAFLAEYRRRYGIMPSAWVWLAWLNHDKRRLEESRRCGSTEARARSERR